MAPPGGWLSAAALVAMLGASLALGADFAAPPRLVLGSHHSPVPPLDAPLAYSYASPYFERSYPTGWFTSPIILNTHVETSQLYSLLTQRKRTYYPSFITGHCVDATPSMVLFNILWVPNSKNLPWTLVLNVEGQQFQDEINKLTAAGQHAKQVDSYAFKHHGTLYYAAIFVAQEMWPPGTNFTIAFGASTDSTYCCGPGSRWATLQRAGFKPLSVSVTWDPISRATYVADAWNDDDSKYWQGAVDLAPGELQPILAALPSPLVPVYVKSYRWTDPQGYSRVSYSYIAVADNSVSGTCAASIDVSRSGLELIAKLVKYPPLFVSSYFSEVEVDPQDPSSGEMYGALWQGLT